MTQSIIRKHESLANPLILLSNLLSLKCFGSSLTNSFLHSLPPSVFDFELTTSPFILYERLFIFKVILSCCRLQEIQQFLSLNIELTSDVFSVLSSESSKYVKLQALFIIALLMQRNFELSSLFADTFIYDYIYENKLDLVLLEVCDQVDNSVKIVAVELIEKYFQFD